MMEDFLDPRNAVGMPDRVDASVALEFLLTAKNGVRTYAIALTEAATPEIRSTLRKQLEAAIKLHGEVTDLMIEKEWFHPYDLGEQQKIDVKAAETALSIASMNLFPTETDRLGTFATPKN